MEKKYPLPPILPPDNHVDFIIEIIQVYKGNVAITTKALRANELNSSCYWEPEIGKRYIFYFDSISTESQKQTIEIFGCQRRIRNDNRNYNSEIIGLVTLIDKINGKFKIDQSELLQIENEKYISLQGEFKDGKRHGKWTIAEPIDYYGDNTTPIKENLILKYESGRLICTKYKSPNDKHVKRHFAWSWHQYYEEQKSS